MENFDLHAVGKYPDEWAAFMQKPLTIANGDPLYGASYMVIHWFEVFNAYLNDDATQDQMIETLRIMQAHIAITTKNPALAYQTMIQVEDYLARRRQALLGKEIAIEFDLMSAIYPDKNRGTQRPEFHPRPPGQ